MIKASLPITVLLAVKNEVINIQRCMESLHPAQKIVVLDSDSNDGTVEAAKGLGAEVVQFCYKGGYPKKRQWALENQQIDTPWVFFVDADEVVTEQLWVEIEAAIQKEYDAFFITKGFHFLGKKFRFGGFSHAAILLAKREKIRFEKIFNDSSNALDMEVHERVIVDGKTGTLKEPLIHEDFKGLEAYIDRHNKYSTWEARLRHNYFKTGRYGEDMVQARLLGNNQERRRFLKHIAMKTPCEPMLWFAYHYLIKLGFLEGKAGFIASRIRSHYIFQVRAKLHELKLNEKRSNSLPQ